jgi:hypothetical protein
VAETGNDAIVRRYAEACVRGDLAAMRELRDPGWVADWPQSGERVRGSDQFQRVNERYPGGSPTSDLVRIVGSEDRWTVTAAQTLVRITGAGDFWWTEWRMRYPDDRDYLCVSLLELHGGRITRETVYWAEPFEAPSWRADLVERLDP